MPTNIDSGWHRDTDPAVVTETDISDPERDAMSRWMRCDECNDVFQAIDGYDYGDICLRCAMAEQD